MKSSIIVDAEGTGGRYWRDIWLYRELFYFFTWRDILVRYKQTIIGITWVLIRPLLTMLAFTVVFSKIAKLPSDGTPYPILVLTGLIPWQFFSGALSDAGNSLINNSSMVSKVFFPRIVIPISAIMVNIADLLISIALLIIIMAWYKYIPTWRLLTIPLFILLAFMMAVGAGLWLSSLNVKYRDFRYIIPFIIQVGLYISPIGFSSSVIPEKWMILYNFNPMVGVIDGFRWATAMQPMPMNWDAIGVSTSIATLLIISGYLFFRKTEIILADVI